MDGTVIWQRVEGAGILAVVLAGLWLMGLPFAVWIAVVVFFLPDLSFAAYLAGPRVGAWVYNLLHLYALGAVVAVAGVLAGHTGLTVTGLLWIAHCGMDRALGYGLKRATGFRDTHLGPL